MTFSSLGMISPSSRSNRRARFLAITQCTVGQKSSVTLTCFGGPISSNAVWANFRVRGDTGADGACPMTFKP
jgi:hypothetical protein